MGPEDLTPPVQKDVPPQGEAATDRDRRYFDRVRELLEVNFHTSRSCIRRDKCEFSLKTARDCFLTSTANKSGSPPPNPPRWSCR